MNTKIALILTKVILNWPQLSIKKNVVIVEQTGITLSRKAKKLVSNLTNTQRVSTRKIYKVVTFSSERALDQSPERVKGPHAARPDYYQRHFLRPPRSFLPWFLFGIGIPCSYMGPFIPPIFAAIANADNCAASIACCCGGI
ncbi:hypothetical protein BpHYR1_044497 [Brachionus plicatilis]|uniref:Uncharacterized protein n=1 Tax=Brachionus plicatilis TaxID=10195 RepID=A0A3M7SYX0_BRAPC|nr:hypothetical protein BpHYR1_044497 [Brachionus plicatilis]